MKKKQWIYITIALLLLLVTPRLYKASYALWRYSTIERSCGNVGRVPILIYTIDFLSINTDRGNMYPGDIYGVPGEGAWLGNATLVYVGTQGAGFVLDYPSGDQRLTCKWLAPRNLYPK